MCHERIYVKSSAILRDETRCWLAVRVSSFVYDDFSPSNEAVTNQLSGLSSRALTHGFGIEILQFTKPEPALLKVKLSSRAISVFTSYHLPVATSQQIYFKRLSGRPASLGGYNIFALKIRKTC